MSQSTKEWFEEAYKDLTDDERIAENKRRHEIKTNIEDKKSDTGYE